MGLGALIRQVIGRAPRAAVEAAPLSLSGTEGQVQAIARALGQWQGQHPGVPMEGLRISAIPDMAPMGSYLDKAIRISPDQFDDPEHLLGVLSHEMKHYTDDMAGQLPDEFATPYWMRPSERRAFSTELRDVMDIRGRETGQPYLFPESGIQQLVDNQVGYGMDTLALQQALGRQTGAYDLGQLYDPFQLHPIQLGLDF